MVLRYLYVNGNMTFSSSPLSVCLLWFSHFDVNLFRHRHFWFIIVSVNKTIFLIQNGQRGAFPGLFIGNII